MRSLKRTIFFQSLPASIWLQLLVFTSLCGAADDAQVRVELALVRSSRGHVLISVFASERGWPSHPALAVRVAKVAAKKGALTRVFSGLKPARYGVAVIHDENDNKKLDRTSREEPIEGYGFSCRVTGSTAGNVNVDRRAATFQEASVEVNSPSTTVQIRINYPSAQ